MSNALIFLLKSLVLGHFSMSRCHENPGIAPERLPDEEGLSAHLRLSPLGG